MLDFFADLKFGPKVTYRPDPDAPSIYASEEEWAAYRQRQNDVNQELMRLANKQPVAMMDAPAQGQADLTEATNAALIGEAVQDPAYKAKVATPGQGATELAPGTKKHPKQDLINETYAQMGVKAFTDEKGQLVLTNNPAAEDAKGAMKPFGRDAMPGLSAPSQPNIVAPNTPNSVNGLINSLRNAKNYDEAIGISTALNESLALESSRIEAEAMRYAQNKLGIPFLEQSLASNQALDMQALDYVPGIGDSPITAKVRQQLDQARGMADIEAKRFLAQNTTYASMKAAAANADMILKSKERGQGKMDEIQARAEITAAARAEAKREEEALLVESLPAHSRERLLMLVPSIGQSDNPNAAMGRTLSQRKTDKEFVAAITAEESKFPALALRGNQYAESVLVAQEAAKTGENPDVIRARIRNLKQVMEDPKALRDMVASSVPAGTSNREQLIKDKILELNKKKLDKESEEAYKTESALLALDFARKSATSAFVADAGSWASKDPVLGEAARQALKVTGSAALTDILDAYIGESTGAEAVTKAKQLLSIAEGQALKYQDSVFGMPSVTELNALVTSRIQAKMGMWAKIQQGFETAKTEQNARFLGMFPRSSMFTSPYLQEISNRVADQGASK